MGARSGGLRGLVAFACALGASVWLLPVERASAHSPHDDIVDVAVSSAYSDDHTVFAISRTLLLRSTDRGTTWSRPTAGLEWRGAPTSVAVAPGDPAIVYASGYGSGVFRSSDGGVTWTDVGGNLSRRTLMTVAVSPWSPDVVFGIAADGAVWLTPTGGRRWQRVDTLASTTTVAFAPDADGVVFVGDQHGGVHRSDDRGATWAPVEAVAADDPVRTIGVSPRFTNDATFFVGTGRSGVFRTDDGGTSFSRVADLRDVVVTALALSPDFSSDHAAWAATERDGVFVSRDGGDGWHRSDEGLSVNPQAGAVGQPDFGVVQVAADRAEVLFVAGFDGLFRSDDGGRRWDELDTQPASLVMSVAPSPTYADDGTLVVATYLNGLLASKDDGASWRPTNAGLASRFDWTRRPDYVNRLFSAVFSPAYADDRTLFAVARGFVFRSEDAGAHWDAVVPDGAIVPGESPPDYFFVVPSPGFATDRTVLLGTDRGKVFRSHDGGKRYERLGDLGQPISSLVVSPDFASDGTAYAGTPEGVFRTDDRGTTWTRTAWPDGAGAETALAVSSDHGNDGTVFAGSALGLLVSTDRGASWRVSGDGVAGEVVDGVAVSPDFVSDGLLFASVRGRGLMRSADRGATWEDAPIARARSPLVPANFYFATAEPIVFSPDFTRDQTVFAFAGSELMQSTDAGRTWDALDVPTTRHSTDEQAAKGPLRATPTAGDAATPAHEAHTDASGS